jgi:hypothetical protein
MNDKVIIPFICSKCGAEFAESDGGICHFCNKPFCRCHLLSVEGGEKEIKYVCLNCKIKYIDKKIREED